MIISGKKVYLRTVREADLDYLYEKECDIALRGQYFPVFISSIVSFKEGFQKNGFWDDNGGDMLVCDVNTHAIVGMLFAFKGTPYWSNLEVGYRLLDLDLRGKGIMPEAVTLFNYVLFSSKKINRLELKIFPENTASKRVAEKCGYQFEGIARGVYFHGGAYRDMEIYSLVRSEAPATLDALIDSLP